VTIDEEELASWPSVQIVDGLVDSMGRVSVPDLEDAGRSGYAVENIDTDLVTGDLPVFFGDFGRQWYQREPRCCSAL
jgi:hypothetical protein